MAKSSSISLLLVCSTPAFEARNLLSLKKGEVSTVVESLDLPFPKGSLHHILLKVKTMKVMRLLISMGDSSLFIIFPALMGGCSQTQESLDQVLELVTLLRFMVIILCKISFSFMGNVVIVLNLLHLLD